MILSFLSSSFTRLAIVAESPRYKPLNNNTKEPKSRPETREMARDPANAVRSTPQKNAIDWRSLTG